MITMQFCLWFLLSILISWFTMATDSIISCDLDCPRNAPCRFGHADFSGHIDVLKSEMKSSRDGMHCDCPVGWTGILCDKKYETCTNQNGHECYNGGKCILGLEDKYGNEQLFCDCSSALGYVGKYCETPFEQKCGVGNEADDAIFCVNGGECNRNFPVSSSQPCLCDEGWEGYRCEYKKNEVPECPLDCQNGGVCFVGTIANAQSVSRNHPWSLEESEELMFCSCRSGFGGRLCEASAELCGNGSNHMCLNGGKCIATIVETPDGKVRSQHHCDCTAATNSNNDRFAGKYCEHRATSMCSENDWLFFCTQGGTCKSNPTEGCSCLDGTAGSKCQFITDNSVQGTGTKNNSNTNLNDKKDDIRNDEYNNDQDQDTMASGKNKIMEECDYGFCLNGGFCVQEEIFLKDDTREMREYCDCSRAYDANSKYAGKYCQYKSTSICFVEDTLQDLVNESFCVHNGVCQVDGNCDCPSGWTGQFCELRTSETKQHSLNEFDTNDYSGDDDTDFETCGDFVCYNGGTCIQVESLQSHGSNKIDPYCDCSTAFDEMYLYAGMSCEFPSTQICSRPKDSEGLEGFIFCTNHGTCMDDFNFGCDCLPGFFGRACEYESYNMKNYFKDEDEEIEEDAACGHGICQHGGECITTNIYIDETETVGITYSCDCSTAFDDDVAYLGPWCEYPSTTICEPPKTGQSLSSAQFCVNQGTCKQDPSEGCECGIGFTGRFCQLPVNRQNLPYYQNNGSDINKIVHGNGGDSFIDCNLNCLNGGVCVQDAKDLGSLLDTIEDVDHLNRTYAEDQLAHCSCLNGWIGLTCEIKLEVCGEDQHFCLHGSECVANVDTHKGYSCDCSKADGITRDKDEIHVFSGNSCQYIDTDICMIEEENPGQTLYFCVNGGKCNAWVSGDEPDPGCTCPDSYDGPHCEVLIGVGKNYASTDKGISVSVIIGSLLVLLGVLGFFAILYLRSRIKITKRKRANTASEKRYSVTGKHSSQQRQCEQEFDGSSKQESTVYVTDVPTFNADIDQIVFGHEDKNDGIMNDRSNDSRPCSEMENPWVISKTKVQGQDFV